MSKKLIMTAAIGASLAATAPAQALADGAVAACLAPNGDATIQATAAYVQKITGKIPSRWVSFELPDGALDMLTVTTPSNAQVTQYSASNGKIRVSAYIEAESDSAADALAGSVQDDMNAVEAACASGSSGAAKIQTLALRGVHSGFETDYHCSRSNWFGKVSVKGACLVSVAVTLPAGGTKTALTVDQTVVAKGVPHPISFDTLKQMLSTGSDGDKEKALDIFFANSPGRVLSVDQAGQVITSFTFNQEDMANKIASHIRMGHPSDDAASLVSATGAISGASDSARIALIDAVAAASGGSRFVHVADVASLLGSLNFDKMKALEALSGHVVDPQNAGQIADKFVFDSEKDQATQLLSR